MAQNTQLSSTSDTTQETPKIPDDQLDSLVAPIALYPDPLLSQILVASTYPLELIQLQQWMERNKNLKGQALADAVQQQPWDPSIQSMVAFPDVVKRLAGNIQWTTDLGNAFLAQQSDVMDAVQRMRAKAQETGNLSTTSQQIVQTQNLDNGQQVIVIQQANPQVVYVPSYDPTVVFGAPVYPYPPFYYSGYMAGSAITFGIGVALGATWGGGWGYNCGWGHGNVNVNYNNNYNRVAYNNGNSFSRNTYNNVNVNNINRGNVNVGNQIASGNWQHNPQHRGGAPYGDRVTSNKFGGRISGQQPSIPSNRPGGGSVNRPSTLPSNRPASGSGLGNGAIRNRPDGGGGLGSSNFNRPSSLPTGGNSIGNRNISSASSAGGVGESARGGAAARASSARGARSFSGGGSRTSGGGGGGRSGGGGGGRAGGRR